MAELGFIEVARHLDETISRLKRARDTDTRRALLLDMRLLLVEVDRIIFDLDLQPSPD